MKNNKRKKKKRRKARSMLSRMEYHSFTLMLGKMAIVDPSKTIYATT